ncbi:MAG: response regulator [Maricaulis sp.]|nr:response regulator [Maricaulis sp.]
MAFSESFKPHIPYLRRHARLLTGNQARGDAAVRDALQAAAAGQVTIDTELPPRVALYHLFHACWQPDPSSPPQQDRPQAHLDRVPALARRALLLTSVEGFPARDAARILGLTATDIDLLLVEAQNAIEADLRTRVLIIEDEPIVALDIEAIVSDAGHDVEGVARTQREAVDLFRASDIGLVLADIQLADGSSGIDAVNDILADQDVPVIFITAFPERLLTGERPEPAYLITKPFMPETVAATIGQVLFFFEPAEPAPAQ